MTFYRRPIVQNGDVYACPTEQTAGSCHPNVADTEWHLPDRRRCRTDAGHGENALAAFSTGVASCPAADPRNRDDSTRRLTQLKAGILEHSNLLQSTPTWRLARFISSDLQKSRIIDLSRVVIWHCKLRDPKSGIQSQ